MIATPICVDASFIIRLVADPSESQTPLLWEAWERAGAVIIAPTLIFYEVTNALYRYQRAMMLSASAVEAAIQAALALPLQLHSDSALHQEARLLAARLTLPAAYDAHYLALAVRHSAAFWTADARLANAVSARLTWVHLVTG